LEDTVKLNEGKIVPVQKGLGNSEGEISIAICETNSGANSLLVNGDNTPKETIQIITLDKFVEENNLKQVDFIKADIEGAERDLLKGAAHVLKKFAPKLAICTYHLPDDPQVLEQIILEANPNYRVVHLRNKLFAAVVS
jgi:FkbM family methyltransferase